jgi:phosphomannomutase
MALVKSVSGIRGTIGGAYGENLTPADIISFTSAYASWLKSSHTSPTVVIGRDGRISGPHVSALVVETLRAMGVNVIEANLSTTPSIEMYVTYAKAQGGIVITASHNPRDWNALKFLNEKGEFISQADGERILAIADSNTIQYAPVDDFGSFRVTKNDVAHHISCICKLELVDVQAIHQKHFHVVVDCINSTGAIAIPTLLEALGCSFTLLNERITGEFAHNPEPLEENLADLCREVSAFGAMIGIAVDPDVDRLALVDEHGTYFGEEYTLVAVADYVLQHTPGPCVSNLSSSMALRDLAAIYGQSYTAAKVGEVHVVEEMKRTGAVIGGEGNGGIIYPALHYGRDALVGIALILSYMAKSGLSLSELKKRYSAYVIAKSKIALPNDIELETLFEKIASEYTGSEIDTRDGLKIHTDDGWMHLRASNTEPIIRIYAESGTKESAKKLASGMKKKIVALFNG